MYFVNNKQNIIGSFGSPLLLLCRFFYFFLFRGNKIYEPPRYMTVNRAAEQLMEIVKNRRDQGQTELRMYM